MEVIQRNKNIAKIETENKFSFDISILDVKYPAYLYEINYSTS